jgi:hypothetical protein
LELGLHENRLDVHGALLEVESQGAAIKNWGEDLKSPRIVEHQGHLWAPDGLVRELQGKGILRLNYSRSFSLTC